MRCTFRLEGVDAASVALVGSFNEWSTTRHLMTRVNGKWETDIALPPGRHSYFFFALDKDQIVRGSIHQMGSTIQVGLPNEVSRTLPEEQFSKLTA
jgi:1,4-alpha-glucan branching enzyme